ncbi:MAG: hypothetical protein ACLRXC_06315 [[Clostridium] leptum]
MIWRSDGQYAYVANELANTVVVLQEGNRRLQPVQLFLHCRRIFKASPPVRPLNFRRTSVFVRVEPGT